MYSTAYNRVRHYGIYGLVIDKYTITTTAARGDFPLHHSSLRIIEREQRLGEFFYLLPRWLSDRLSVTSRYSSR